MISIKVYKNSNGEVFGVEADNHGAKLVCAAVSALVINAVNSIESLTCAEFTCDFAEDGGYLSFRLSEQPGRDDGLLLESMYLGLRTIAEQYPRDLKIREVLKKEVL